MVNTDEFILRLEQLFANHGLSASSFSDKIGVQRSSISHLLSGRNKPSLDFILKIMAAFPDTDLYWLLTGNANTNATASASKEPEIKIKDKSEIDKIIVFYSDGSFSEHKSK